MVLLNIGRKKRDLVNCVDCCVDVLNENGFCNVVFCGFSKLLID